MMTRASDSCIVDRIGSQRCADQRWMHFAKAFHEHAIEFSIRLLLCISPEVALSRRPPMSAIPLL
jgi:hypothetical protein